jgi:hypothetical protein
VLARRSLEAVLEWLVRPSRGGNPMGSGGVIAVVVL